MFSRLARIRCVCLTILIGFGHPLCDRARGQEPVRPTAAEKAEGEAFFESKVRPLLIKHCVECHGPDDQSGELRLDRQVYFRKGGGSGKLVVPSNPDASRFIRAIRYRDNGLQMPPDNKLSDEAIDVFTDWVQRGAYWPDDSSAEPTQDKAEMTVAEQIDQKRESHWAFQSIDAAEPPGLDDLQNVASVWTDASAGEESITSIDRFVLAKLADAGLTPNPRADRRTLIHRAYFSLLGLPPSYEEVQAFLADEQPDAFARLVDRCLDSPHYGERWARHWLDIARYGDTKGYLPGSQDERYPFAFTFRDYVIDAFNDDKPFDQFIVEQLAADRLGLEGDDKKALAAMGFLTVGRRFMNKQSDIIDDQIDVITRGFLGISVACARCHDHKYDPIPTADYYSLYGVFASSQEPGELPLLGTPEQTPEYEAFLKAKEAKQGEVDKWIDERRVETEQELRSRVADYLVFIARSLPQYRKGKVSLQGERGALRPAAVQRWQQYLVNPDQSSQPVWQLLRQLAALKPEEFEAKAIEMIDQAIGAASKGDDVTVPRRLLDALKESRPKSLPDAVKVFGEQLEAVDAKWGEATKADSDLEQLPDAGDETLRQLLWDQNAPTRLDSVQMVRHLDQGQRNRYNQLKAEVAKVDATHPGAPPRGMVMVDRPNPVEPVIFRRGIPSNRGDRVPRRFLQVLEHVDGGQPFQDGSGRLELARAIADPDNPLTARVIVNRIWQHQFGEGLVRTPSDLGTRGESPTHPELLDHLAADFVASGWSIKHLQRRIMLSATWQQSSTIRDDLMKADPENRLLWHMPRRRLEFEPLRDRILVAAGRLDKRVGGRSVMIHKDATRRGLYAYVDREDPPGLFASFDVPSPDASQAKRTKTTVPQQALYLMNSPFVIDQAKSLAERTTHNIAESGGDAVTQRSDNTVDEESGRIEFVQDQRIRQLYRLALSRDPTEHELSSGRQFVTQNAEASVDPWTQLAQVLLLCNEFAFVD